MKLILSRRNTIWKMFAVFFITNFLMMSGCTRAQTVDNSLNTTPPRPAYINNLNDLIHIEVTQRLEPLHPLPPRTSNVDIIELLQQLNESLIRHYLENLSGFGPRLSGTETCNQAAYYLYKTFYDMGLDVRYHNYTDDIVSGSNIEATLYGTDSTNIFIICAHYDSVTAGPGADDDGSGVAVVLAAAEIMRNYDFLHSIRFVCFSGEEQGLIGSRHYAEDAYNNNDSIIAVLNADMIGFAPSSSDGSNGKIFENAASEWIVAFTQNISILYADYINIEVISQGQSSGSDHYYFWQFGYDAICYHEFNFNDYYHTANDTIEHMNITYSTHFSRLILATLAEMALLPRPVLEITSISGGLGIRAQVTNIGNINASDVKAMIVVTGGLFGFINISTQSENTVMPPHDSMQLKAMLFRVGRIRITVTADASNANQVTKHATALLFGPFVIKVVNIP